MNCTKWSKKKICNGYECMTKILKFLKFQQLLKHILTVFSSLLGASSMFAGKATGSQPFNYHVSIAYNYVYLPQILQYMHNVIHSDNQADS